MRVPHTLMFAADGGSGIPGSSGPLQPGGGLPGIPGSGPSGTPGPATPPAAAPAPTPLTGGGDPPPPVFSRPDTPAPDAGDPATYELASWGSRALATVLDTIFVLVGFVVLLVVPFVVLGVSLSAGAEGEIDPDLSTGAAIVAVLWFLVVLALAFLYAPVTMARTNGATPGKAIMGIRVVRENGKPISFTYGLFREVAIKGFLIGGISQFTLGLATLLDYLWPLWDDQRRALHDMAAKSRVVRG